MTIHIKLTRGGQLEIEQLIETIVVKLGADKTNMSDDYSGNMNGSNGKSKDIITEYAKMLELFEIWKSLHIFEYWINELEI